MKRKIFSLAFILILIVSSTSVKGQRGDYTGTWKLDRTKSVIATEWPVLVKIRIEIKGDTLLTERFYDTGDGQEYPFTEKLSLDNKEYSMIIYEMPRKIKASLADQEATLIFESTTTFNGSGGNEDFVSKETWKVDKATGILTLGFVNKTSAGEAPGSLVYIKE
jgi:hypothetical protein